MSEKGNQNPNLKGSDTEVVWPESEEELNAIPEEMKRAMIAKQIMQKRIARERRIAMRKRSSSLPPPAVGGSVPAPPANPLDSTRGKVGLIINGKKRTRP